MSPPRPPSFPNHQPRLQCRPSSGIGYANIGNPITRIKKPKTHRYPSLKGTDPKFRRNHRHALHGTMKALVRSIPRDSWCLKGSVLIGVTERGQGGEEGCCVGVQWLGGWMVGKLLGAYDLQALLRVVLNASKQSCRGGSYLCYNSKTFVTGHWNHVKDTMLRG